MNGSDRTNALDGDAQSLDDAAQGALNQHLKPGLQAWVAESEQGSQEEARILAALDGMPAPRGGAIRWHLLGKVAASVLLAAGLVCWWGDWGGADPAVGVVGCHPGSAPDERPTSRDWLFALADDSFRPQGLLSEEPDPAPAEVFDVLKLSSAQPGDGLLFLSLDGGR